MGVEVVPLAINHKLDMTLDKAFPIDIRNRFSDDVTMYEDHYNNENKFCYQITS